ncbi:hypothetical protein HK097_002374, partial [Rhizophlyctis rosea]
AEIEDQQRTRQARHQEMSLLQQRMHGMEEASKSLTTRIEEVEILLGVVKGRKVDQVVAEAEAEEGKERDDKKVEAQTLDEKGEGEEEGREERERGQPAPAEDGDA